MKIFVVFLTFFGYIVLPIAMFFAVIALAPPEFVLNRDAISLENGTLLHPERIFPGFSGKAPFIFPGAAAGLAAGDGQVKAWVLICRDSKEAEAVDAAYRRVVARAASSQSSGPGYFEYSLKSGLHGRVERVNEVVLHVQGFDREAVDRAFQQSGVLVLNTEKNAFSEISRPGRHPLYLVIFLIVYVACLLPIGNRVARWAFRLDPKPGVPPVEESDLRQRLLALNGLNLPFHVVEGRRGNLDVVWRLADARWAGLMTANRVRRVELLRLSLSDHDKSCRVIQISKSLSATANLSTLKFSFSFSYFRGIQSWQRDYEKQIGLMFKNGTLTLDTAYQYQFNASELKNPVVTIVLGSGWRLEPVIFFSKVLGG